MTQKRNDIIGAQATIPGRILMMSLTSTTEDIIKSFGLFCRAWCVPYTWQTVKIVLLYAFMSVELIATLSVC